MNASGTIYRPDIDGLRAVAVLPVVLFHAGIGVTSGGFVGVDVFFVISGYLITGIIARELNEGRFSLISFYERRVRRILPALFVTMAVSLAASTALLMPEDLKRAAQSMVAASLFASNVLFFLEAGYFEASAYTKPLLHSWSLAIEEQFYVVIPLLLMALARWGGGRFALWIAGITLVSLGLSVLTTQDRPTAAYYLLPWRAWELGIGALLALGMVPPLRAPWLREAAAALGLAMILGAVVFLDKSTPFPGAAALLPVLGAALIIQAGASPAPGVGSSLVGRLLSTAPMVGIGKISYSLYLWHWPVIVLFVYWKMDMPAGAEIAVLIALAFMLAWASWRFVEQPFRQPAGGPNRGKLFLGAGAVMALLIAVGGGLHLANGLPGRLSPEAREIANFVRDYSGRDRDCRPDGLEDGQEGALPCLYGDPDAGPPRVALWGDSAAAALIPAFDTAGRAAGMGVALYTKDGCPSVQGFEIHQFTDGFSCDGYLRRSAAALQGDPHIDTVVLVLRGALYTVGWLDYGFGEWGRAPLVIGTPEAPLPDDTDRLEFLMDGLDRTVADLRAAGKRVALVYPLPESGNTLPSSMARIMLRGGQPQDLTLPRARFDRRNGALIAAFDALADRHEIAPLRLHDLVCSDTECALMRDGVPLFYDRTHLTRTAARGMAPAFADIFAGIRAGSGNNPEETSP